jgi:hypothetical protein
MEVKTNFKYRIITLMITECYAYKLQRALISTYFFLCDKRKHFTYSKNVDDYKIEKIYFLMILICNIYTFRMHFN